MAERWLDKVSETDDAGTHVLYKLDQRLFRRYTRNASEVNILKGQFADDVALLATTREAADQAIKTYGDVATSFGMTVSLQKTKFLVASVDVLEEDKLPITI